MLCRDSGGREKSWQSEAIAIPADDEERDQLALVDASPNPGLPLAARARVIGCGHSRWAVYWGDSCGGFLFLSDQVYPV